MENYRLICVLLAMYGVGLALGGQVNFTDCPSQETWITTAFDISGCASGSTQCSLVAGQTYTFTVTGSITAVGVVNRKPFLAQANAPGSSGTNPGLPLFSGDLCNNIQDPNQHCPLTGPWSGSFAVNYTIPLVGLPLIPFPVQLRGWNDTMGALGQAMDCLQFTAHWIPQL